ncbi:MAG: hypothetical protein HY074_06485 [Deltaproteobacteria bacterium]|nr:hypothetical protein [Deltaproteobacteria bacterium]
MINLSEQLDLLCEIQTIDIEVTRSVRESHCRPAAIERLKRDVEAFRGIFTAAKRLLDETRNEIAAATSELDAHRAARTKLEKQRKKPGMPAELERVKVKIYSLDSALAALVARERQATEELKALSDGQASRQLELKSQQQLALEDAGSLQEKLRQISKRRGRYLSRVSGELLAHYERLRSLKGGLGIVRVTNRFCTGCNMTLPAQVYVEVMRGRVLTGCPRCQRMLCCASDKAP